MHKARRRWAVVHRDQGPGQRVEELDGRPALEQLSRIAQKSDERELKLIQRALRVGIPPPSEGDDEEVDYLVRGVLGQTPNGGLAVGDEVLPADEAALPRARRPGGGRGFAAAARALQAGAHLPAAPTRGRRPRCCSRATDAAKACMARRATTARCCARARRRRADRRLLLQRRDRRRRRARAGAGLRRRRRGGPSLIHGFTWWWRCCTTRAKLPKAND